MSSSSGLPAPSWRRLPTTSRTERVRGSRVSGLITSRMIARAPSAEAASSSASITTANRRGGPLGPDRAGPSSAVRPAARSGSPADAARAISCATSSAVFPFACTAQCTEPGSARTSASCGASPAAATGSAVVTIRPRTADLPEPGEPVTTRVPVGAAVSDSHTLISSRAVRRPRNRSAGLACRVRAPPRARGIQCAAASVSRARVQPHSVSAASPEASGASRSAASSSPAPGRIRAAYHSVIARTFPPAWSARVIRPTTAS